jgi:ATPase subunit of ABC transporter with duplicated ATPase domains
MQLRSAIILHNISYTHEQAILFKDLDFAFPMQKMALVGRNGIGKTTLLKLIMGELQPTSGSIQVHTSLRYCPQNFEFAPDATVADAFDPEEPWQTHKQLAQFDLKQISLDRTIASLSGGERTRLLLTKCFSLGANFLILDEPSNNLDTAARELLYQAIRQWPHGLLIVSHDRTLLNVVNSIAELTTLGLALYGGNYGYYQEQKALELNAIEREYADAQKSVKKTQQSIQSTKEKHDQKKSKGMAERRANKVDKLTANSRQGRSERSQNRMLTQETRMTEETQQQLKSIREKLDVIKMLNLDLPNTYIPKQKLVLKIESLRFSYLPSPCLLHDFNLIIQGPEQIALTGSNGSGKSTLFKLLRGELTPQHGTIELGIHNIAYLDQHCTQLDPELSVLQSFLKLNPDIDEQQARFYLAQFLFRNTAALKIVKNLSGGEKLRAALCCSIFSKTAPQLLLLDEPTNHLDLDSIKHLETALNQYQGAIIVISHDQNFLQNIGISRIIELKE